MEYYLWILNRSFEMTVTASSICGAFVSGPIAGNSPSVADARASNDATKLVDAYRLAEAREFEPGSPEYLALHRFNFAIPHAVVSAVRFDSRSKWGMGAVPHSGRLHVLSTGGDRRELILLGRQDGVGLLRAIGALGYPVVG